MNKPPTPDDEPTLFRPGRALVIFLGILGATYALVIFVLSPLSKP